MTINSTRNIGINNTNPQYRLDLNGDLNYTGAVYKNAVLNYTHSAITAGYVPFGSGTTLTSNSNLFWDSVNARLGIGTITPAQKLDINGSVKA